MALFEQTLDQLLLAGEPSRMLVAGDQNGFRTERGVQSIEHIAAEKDLNFDGHSGLVSEVAKAARKETGVNGRVFERKWIRNHLHVNETDACIEFGSHILGHFQSTQSLR